MIWILATLGSVGIIGMAVEHGNHNDAFYTMIGHIAIFATALLTYKEARAGRIGTNANGAKLDAVKVERDRCNPT